MFCPSLKTSYNTVCSELVLTVNLEVVIRTGYGILSRVGVRY